MVKLLGVDCSFNCFDVGGIIAADMEPGALRRRLVTSISIKEHGLV
jgi:hypothetical protein